MQNSPGSRPAFDEKLQDRALAEVATIKARTFELVRDLQAKVGEKSAAELVGMHDFVNELTLPRRVDGMGHGRNKDTIIGGKFVDVMATGLRGFTDGLIMGSVAERAVGNAKLADRPGALAKVMRAKLAAVAGDLGPNETNTSDEVAFSAGAQEAVDTSFDATDTCLTASVQLGVKERTIAQILKMHEMVDEIVGRARFATSDQRAAFIGEVYQALRSVTHGLTMGNSSARADNRSALKNPAAMSELMRSSLRDVIGTHIGAIETTVTGDDHLRVAREDVGAILGNV